MNCLVFPVRKYFLFFFVNTKHNSKSFSNVFFFFGKSEWKQIQFLVASFINWIHTIYLLFHSYSLDDFYSSPFSKSIAKHYFTQKKKKKTIDFREMSKGLVRICACQWICYPKSKYFHKNKTTIISISIIINCLLSKHFQNDSWCFATLNCYPGGS